MMSNEKTKRDFENVYFFVLEAVLVKQRPRGRGGGVLPEKLGGGVRPASQNLTLFMTKICDIPYPIYDLTKNLKTNL